MAWTDTFTSSTDWSARTHLNMFVDACNERLTVLGLTTLSQYRAGGSGKTVSSITKSGGTVTVTITAHGYTSGREIFLDTTDANYYGVFTITVVNANTFTFTVSTSLASPGTGTYTSYLLPDDAQRASVVAAMQAVVRDHAGSFLNQSTPVVVSGFLATNPVTYASVMSAIGAGSKFTRKAPRVVATTTSTSDIYGNAAASGQVAILQSTGLTRQYNGSSWIISATTPDLLSNKSSSPNGIPTDSDGTMQAGDYFGPWIWNELRDALNKLTLTPASTTVISNTGGTGSSGNSNPSPYTSASAAYAAAAANCSLTTGTGGSANSEQSYVDITGTSPGTYNASIGVGGCTYRATTSVSTSKIVRAYFRALITNAGPFFATSTYDAQGTGYAEGVVTNFFTSSANTSANTNFSAFDGSSLPTVYNAPSSGSDWYTGFASGGVVALFDWQFTYR